MIYVNDLAANINGATVQFADDTSIVIQNNNINEISQNIKSSMGELVDWFNNNNLTLNSTKTKILRFSTKRDKIHNSTHSLEVCTTKFLGVDVDSSLKWDFHVENLSKTLASINYTLFSLRPFVDQQTLILAYFGLFQCRFSYGIEFWGGNDANLLTIFKLQKRIVRTIFYLGPIDSCKNYFISQNLLTLPCTYILKISELIFKKVIKTTPRLHDHVTRGKNDNLSSTFRLTLFQKNIDYMGPKIFNHLPKKIRDIHSPTIF